jgi:hypothetical protein
VLQSYCSYPIKKRKLSAIWHNKQCFLQLLKQLVTMLVEVGGFGRRIRFRCRAMKTRIRQITCFRWTVAWRECVGRRCRWLRWWPMCFRVGLGLIDSGGNGSIVRSTWITRRFARRTRNRGLSSAARPTAVALTIGLRSGTTNAFPCATTKPDCRNWS